MLKSLSLLTSQRYLFQSSQKKSFRNEAIIAGTHTCCHLRVGWLCKSRKMVWWCRPCNSHHTHPCPRFQTEGHTDETSRACLLVQSPLYRQLTRNASHRNQRVRCYSFFMTRILQRCMARSVSRCTSERVYKAVCSCL